MPQKQKAQDSIIKQLLREEFVNQEKNIKAFVSEEIRGAKDEILNKVDYLIGKYEANEEDQVLALGKDREFEEVLEDHGKRIKSLEKKVQIS